MSGWHLLGLAGASNLVLFIVAVFMLRGKDPWRAARREPLDPAAARRFGRVCLTVAIVNFAIFTAIAVGLIPTDNITPISFAGASG